MGIFSLPRLFSATFHHHRRFSSKSAKRVRNVWISGLIDPNKVTECERSMLYTGQIEEMHRARRKNELRLAELEDHSESIQRHWNQNIQAAFTFFNRKRHNINILDSVDYNAVVESALGAFDGAIHVLCGVGGVQSQSIAVDKQIIRYQLPRLIFINNIDQKGANPWQVLNQERSKFQHHSAAIQFPIGLEDDFKGLVDLVHLKAYYFHGSNGEKVAAKEIPEDLEASVLEKRRELIEVVSRVDDKIAEAFCNRRIIFADDLQEAVRRVTISRKFIPVFMGGGAFKYKGLQLLLDGVLNYLPCPVEASNYCLAQSKNGEKHSLVALAFTLKDRICQITFLRVYEGVVRKGDFITNVNTGKTFEVPQLIGLRNDELEVPPHSIEIRKDKVGVLPSSIEVRKDKMGVPYLIGVRNNKPEPFPEVQEAHAGEIVTLALPMNPQGRPYEETFADGLVRYTKASVDVSESSHKI
ncbi:elongation factor G-2, mitochondrial [Trifolium repens]|nr:elongation factor G-2, mitochondrial [Trifolium repens]